MKEIWRPVPIKKYSQMYEVSNTGKIRSVERVTKNRFSTMVRKSQAIKPNPEKKRGYLMVSLGGYDRQTCTVHRLVALAFIPNPEKKPQVNHKDGNKTNNHVSNLEWVTNYENHMHARGLGLYPSSAGVHNPKNKAVVVVKLDGTLVGEFFSTVEACHQLNIPSRANAVKVLKGQRRHTHGYIFKYK